MVYVRLSKQLEGVPSEISNQSLAKFKALWVKCSCGCNVV